MVMKHTPKIALLGSLSIILISLLLGCGMEEIRSAWYESHEAIGDAQYHPAWGTDAHLIVDDKVAVNIMNNDNMLFLYLSTHDQDIHRLILTAGLTVWLDGVGGKKKVFGIHYPIGERNLNRIQAHYDRSERVELEEDMIERRNEELMDEIEIFGPGKYQHTRLVPSDKPIHGILCHITSTRSYFVYELAVPLTSTDTLMYGIAQNKPKIISIGLETGNLEQKQRFAIESGNREGDIENGPCGRPGGNRNGGPQGGPGEGIGKGDSRSINIWLKIYLSAKR